MNIDFNEDWTFIKTDGSFEIVDLPHDAMIHEMRTTSNRNGDRTGYFPGGKYTYTKEFDLNEKAEDKQFILHFDGVYGQTEVLINGVKVCEHYYGYTPFDADLTEATLSGRNKVEVRVDNSLVPNSRWYTGSGIYRPVELRTRSKDSIEDIHIETICINPVLIKVSCNQADGRVILRDATGKIVAESKIGEIEIEDAKLWSAEHPYLYSCEVHTDTDAQSVKFGIRKLDWSSENGLQVNGETVKLRGGCIHHDNGLLGACAYKEAEYRKVALLKEAGYNAIRSAHNPCSESFLEACDELGMYLLEETFDGWYTPKNHHDYSRHFWNDYKDDMAAMVKRDYNHPSVILYSIGNEVNELGTEDGINLAGQMVEYMRSMDTGRPVTCGINIMLAVWAKQGMGVYKDEEDYVAEPLPEEENPNARKTGSTLYNSIVQRVGSLMSTQTRSGKATAVVEGVADKFDILGLNYGHCRYDMEVSNHPDRILLGTETYINDLYYNWERVEKYNSLIGDFCWTAMDYIGEAGLGAWRYKDTDELPLLAGCGAIDILGNADATNGYQKVIWGLEDIFIGVSPLDKGLSGVQRKAWRFTDVIPSWNWSGYEGKKSRVEVYSRAPYVELVLNGKKIGRKKTKKARAEFFVHYEPGVIKAIAYDEKKVILAEGKLQSGNGTTHIEAKVEENAWSRKLIYVNLEVDDEKGIWCPGENRKLTVSCDGSVRLIGAGSANPYSDDRFTTGSFTTYQGRGQIVLERIDTAKKATVSVMDEKDSSVLQVKISATRAHNMIE